MIKEGCVPCEGSLVRRLVQCHLPDNRRFRCHVQKEEKSDAQISMPSLRLFKVKKTRTFLVQKFPDVPSITKLQSDGDRHVPCHHFLGGNLVIGVQVHSLQHHPENRPRKNQRPLGPSLSRRRGLA